MYTTIEQEVQKHQDDWVGELCETALIALSMVILHVLEPAGGFCCLVYVNKCYENRPLLPMPFLPVSILRVYEFL